MATALILAGCTGSGAGLVATPVPNPASTAGPVVGPVVASQSVAVPLTAPLRLTIGSVGIDAQIEEYTNADVAAAGGWVDPPHRDIVAWWSGGGTPGDPPDNTVYLYGHTSSKPAVFNPLTGVTPGDTVIVTTGSGAMEYVITEILDPIAKDALPQDEFIAAAVPGRLLLIGCYREEGQGTRPTTHNIVVVAQQVAATPLSS